ncbi:MAG: hypothetical protein D6732_04815 [Methanobacteriota archaeon]|nr:MAG: hypothetical protein D6732_04815 [Euryarchaeota archaeon]
MSSKLVKWKNAQLLVLILVLLINLQAKGGSKLVRNDNFELGTAETISMERTPLVSDGTPRTDRERGIHQFQGTQNQDPLILHNEYVNGLISSIWGNNFNDLSSYTEVSGQTVFNDLTSFATTYASSGDGSAGNPYIFQGLFINASVAEMYFDSISDNFVLRDSVVLGKMTLDAANAMRIENTVFFSSSYALRLLGMENLVIAGNTFVANGTTYALSISGSRNLEIRDNTVIVGESGGGIIFTSGTFSITNVNITQNQFQTQKTAIFGTSGLGGSNRIIGNYFNSSSTSTFITLIPKGDLEFKDNTAIVHYTPHQWDGAIFFSGIGGSSGDVWTIRNNTVSGLEDGLSFYSPGILELKNNTIRESLHGVKFYQVDDQRTIDANVIENSQIGFYVRVSTNTTINGTIMRGVDFGAIFELATSNVLNNTRIEDFNWVLHDLTDNNPPNQAINTEELGARSNGLDAQNDSEFDDWATTNGIQGSGTPEDPFVLEGLVITGGLGLGIVTNYTLKLKDVMIESVYNDLIKPLNIVSGSGVILENVTITEATNGIYLETTGFLRMQNITISKLMDSSTIKFAKSVYIEGMKYTESENGLVLSFLSDVIMTSFEFRDNGNKHLFIEGANNLTLSDGEITGGGDALFIIGSDTVTVERTLINSTNTPMFVSESSNVVFRENYVTLTENRGTFEYIDNVNITGNIFIDNKDSVFYAEFTYLNTPFSAWKNYFINNSWVTGNDHFILSDDIILTVGGIGNYWSDLPDGATTYTIQGYVDTAPIRPKVDPLEETHEYASSIAIDVSTTFPVPLASWSVYQNGSVIQNGAWNGNAFQFSFNPTGLGIFTFEIGVRDKYGVNGENTTLKITVIDSIAPVIIPVDDIVFQEGEAGQAIIWRVSDLFPDTYEIYQNNSLVQSGTWNSPTNITVDLTGLEVGSYNFSILVYDTSGNVARDEVIVQVQSFSSTDTSESSSEESTSSSGTISTTPSFPDGAGENGGNERRSISTGLFLLILLMLVANSIALYHGVKSYFEGKY